MAVTVEFMSAAVVKEFSALSDDLQRSFFYIAALMTERGLAGIREPHVKSIGKGLYEIRMHAADGIARALYVVRPVDRVIVVLAFVKKTQKTPTQVIDLALKRAKQVK